MKSVPKGTSKYQAAWIVDDEEKELEEGDDFEDEEDQDMEVDDVEVGSQEFEPPVESLEDDHNSDTEEYETVSFLAFSAVFFNDWIFFLVIFRLTLRRIRPFTITHKTTTRNKPRESPQKFTNQKNHFSLKNYSNQY